MKKFLRVICMIIKVLVFLIAFPIMIFYAIIRGFTEDNLKEKERYRKSDEKLFGLTKYELEEIKKGEFKSSQFSEKDEGDYLDSDDYYNE